MIAPINTTSFFAGTDGLKIDAGGLEACVTVDTSGAFSTLADSFAGASHNGVVDCNGVDKSNYFNGAAAALMNRKIVMKQSRVSTAINFNLFAAVMIKNLTILEIKYLRREHLG